LMVPVVVSEAVPPLPSRHQRTRDELQRALPPGPVRECHHGRVEIPGQLGRLVGGRLGAGAATRGSRRPGLPSRVVTSQKGSDFGPPEEPLHTLPRDPDPR
jgi:hypothetical protein